MAICGYNAEIGAGLELLMKGMAISIEEKSLKIGAVKALEHELFELEEMMRIMDGHGPTQQIFIGLNTFAKKVFLEVKARIEANPDLTVTSVMEDIGPKFIAVIKSTEEFRESLDEPALLASNQIPIQIVARWVNENN